MGEELVQSLLNPGPGNATSHLPQGMCISAGQVNHANVTFLECWTQRPLARGHGAVLIHSFIQQI